MAGGVHPVVGPGPVFRVAGSVVGAVYDVLEVWRHVCDNVSDVVLSSLFLLQ